MRVGFSFLRHLVICALALACAGCATSHAIPEPAPQSRDPREMVMPSPAVEGLDDYSRRKAFASSQLEAGDYASALEELEAAALVRQDDPGLYELFGLAYDGDRQSAKAYESFLKAGQLYLEAGDTDRALGVLGWIRSYGASASDPRAAEFEAGLAEARKSSGGQ